MNHDFLDMLGLLLENDVEFLLVGAHALAAHQRPRATGDLDIWIHPTPENAQRVWQALVQFGAPLTQFDVSDFATPGLIAQFGVPPVRIDLLTSVTGLDFPQAWTNRTTVVLGQLVIPVIGKADLIHNKRKTGRPRDLQDILELDSDNDAR